MRRFVREVLQQAAEEPKFQAEPDAKKHALLAGAWAGLADMYLTIGQNEDGLVTGQKAVEQARLAGDLPILAFALSIVSVLAGLTGRPELAYASSEEGVTIARSIDEKWILGMALITTAVLCFIHKAILRKPNLTWMKAANSFAL